MYLSELLGWLQAIPQDGAEVAYKEHRGLVTLVVTTVDGEEYESEGIEECPVA